MSRYYFDIEVDDVSIADEEGTELADDDTARHEGTQTLAEMARDYIPGRGAEKKISILVRNEAGRALMHLSLNFAIEMLD